MRTIELSANEQLIEAAEEKARSEHTTLDEKFRSWLEEYVCKERHMEQYDETIAQLQGKVKIGHKLTRDEMNER